MLRAPEIATQQSEQRKRTQEDRCASCPSGPSGVNGETILSTRSRLTAEPAEPLELLWRPHTTITPHWHWCFESLSVSANFLHLDHLPLIRRWLIGFVCLSGFLQPTLFPLITNRDLHMLMTECAPTSGRHLLDEPVDFSVSYSATQSALVPSWSSLFPPETGN
jgi:hypothetical protein